MIKSPPKNKKRVRKSTIHEDLLDIDFTKTTSKMKIQSELSQIKFINYYRVSCHNCKHPLQSQHLICNNANNLDCVGLHMVSNYGNYTSCSLCNKTPPNSQGWFCSTNCSKS